MVTFYQSLKLQHLNIIECTQKWILVKRAAYLKNFYQHAASSADRLTAWPSYGILEQVHARPRAQPSEFVLWELIRRGVWLEPANLIENALPHSADLLQRPRGANQILHVASRVIVQRRGCSEIRRDSMLNVRVNCQSSYACLMFWQNGAPII